MVRPVVIGVDGGTEGLRAGVFDLDGRLLGAHAERYETRFPAPAQAEQDPEDWWIAIGRAVPMALKAAGAETSEVRAIAVDTTCCSVVALDADGRAVRPALIWMDVRSGDEAAIVASTGDPALRVNSAGRGPVSAEWMIPKALWLKRNEPALFERALLVGEYQDFMNLRLTGRWAGSVNNVSARWHFDLRGHGRPTRLLRSLGLEDLDAKWPSDILRLGAPVGGLTKAAAEHLGLPEGLPVAQGGADAFIGMIGLGVTVPGRIAFITGSSHLHLGLSEKPFSVPGLWGTYADALLPGLHAVEGGQTSTGSIVAWLKRLMGDGISFDALNRDAAELLPGSEGLLVLDHFQGNRTPYTDSRSRGAFVGLTLKHGPAHLFRAAIEGIACGSEVILDRMREAGLDVTDVRICGGATRSPLWLQIHADVSGIPLTVTEVPDAPLLGSAILAAVGAGLYGSIEEAVGRMVRIATTVEPIPAAHEAYHETIALYRALYPALRDINHGLSR